MFLFIKKLKFLHNFYIVLIFHKLSEKYYLYGVQYFTWFCVNTGDLGMCPAQIMGNCYSRRSRQIRKQTGVQAEA